MSNPALVDELLDLGFALDSAGIDRKRLRPLGIPKKEIWLTVNEISRANQANAPTKIGDRFEFLGFHCVVIADE